MAVAVRVLGFVLKYAIIKIGSFLRPQRTALFIIFKKYVSKYFGKDITIRQRGNTIEASFAHKFYANYLTDTYPNHHPDHNQKM